jgi:uncharacterized protein
MLKVQIFKGEIVPFNFKISAEKFCSKDLLDNGKFIGEIEISGETVNENENVLIRGKIKCCKEFTCDRCLTLTTENQIHDFEEEIESAEIVEDLFNIEELVRDTLVASQSIKNLCKADCKGLCPVCGQNLNDGECNCERLSVDPRLAPLMNFKS